MTNKEFKLRVPGKRFIMKLISTDFSNLDKKTIYDFGDDEAIDVLLKDEKNN